MRSSSSLRNCSERSLPDLFHFRVGNFLTSSAISVSPVSGSRLRAHSICAIAKSEQATELAYKRLRKKAYEKRIALEADTLLYAGYILTFTTLAETELSAWEVLEWYRLRWQIELVFKRFKQIAQLGHLPKSVFKKSYAWTCYRRCDDH